VSGNNVSGVPGQQLPDAVARVVGNAVHAGWERLVRYGAIGPHHRKARRFARFGAGSMVAFPPTVIFGEERIAIGDGTTIGPLATLSAGFPSQVGMTGDPVITVGDRCMLGKGIGIVGHERIEIGDDIWTGHYIYVTDQNHGYEDLDLPIGTQLWKNDPVVIGSGSWLGHGAVVLPGTRIGRHVVVAAGAVVAGLHAPDRSVVAGVPARVVKQYVDGEGWITPPRDGRR
jgi:acetyltransferase-like isoleucine patch superfamily enzyme